MSDILRQRYGQGTTELRDRIIGWSIGSVALIGFLIFAISFVISDAERVKTKDISYQIIDEKSALVTFEVSRTPGTKLECDLKVLNQSFAVVGFKTLEIAAETAPKRVETVRINTTELGVTGLVDSCR
ncbi:MAG: DUF4307 domain-containing protein [Actinomycetota bacterium]